MLHGGEVYSGRTIEYDFSVNISPLGIPDRVYEKLRENLHLLTQYPDRECGDLRRALSAYTGVPAQQILCGNGASELIEAAVRALAPRSILLTAPSFSGYRHAAEGAGAEIRYHDLRREEDFVLTERYLEDLKGKPDMAILCSPANPVGNLIDPALLMRIAEACGRQGTWLMVDECFLGFLESGEQRTMRRLLVPGGGEPLVPGREEPSVSGAERLLVLDAFTKRFAMPGVRLGYLMAQDPEILERIRAQQPEWSVSVPAQIAGIAALEADSTAAGESGTGGYLHRARRLIAGERKRMVKALEALGFHVFPGEANYIFFSSEKELYEPLLSRGILIRRCGNYRGLGEGDYRAAVLRPEENDQLLRALEEVVSA